MPDTPFHPGATPVTDDMLRQWPLPQPDDEADKEERGRILIIGGSREMPGAVILAAAAALRAGAGKISIATGASVAQLVALAIPESRTIGLPETAAGGLTAEGARGLADLASRADAIVIGPGMQDEPSACAFLLELLPRLGDAKVVLDACAMGIVCGKYHAAGQWIAVVALKGATTFIASPDRRLWRHEGGNIGLATSGSGDTLAGIIGGLAARGASLEQACVWGVALHARAGEQLAKSIGPRGYLAREIAEQVPMLMHALRPLD